MARKQRNKRKSTGKNSTQPEERGRTAKIKHRSGEPCTTKNRKPITKGQASLDARQKI